MMRNKNIFVTLLTAFLFLFLTSDLVHAGFPISISESKKPPFPINLPGGMSLSLVVSSSMSGTVRLIKPSGGVAQTISIQYTLGGFSVQLNMDEVGTYSIEESYTLNASASLLGMSKDFPGTRTTNYNNTSPGAKIFKISGSTVSSFSMSLPPGSNISVQSITPSSVEPGQSVTVSLKVGEGGGVLADWVTVSAVWNVNAPEITSSELPPPPNNNPPSALNPRIEPYAPVTGDKLKAVYEFHDPDGHAERNSELVWYKNSVPLPKVTVQSDADKILSQSVTRGERWSFAITPSDGWAKGETRTSDTVTIGNAPPQARNVRILPSSPTSKDDLKLEYDYVDPENDPQGAPEIRWYKNGTLQTQYNNKDVVRSAEGAVKRGDRWYVTVRPKDSFGAVGKEERSPDVTIVNQKPIVEIVSVSGSSGRITVTYNLIDQDGDRCSLRVWYRGGSVGSAEKRKATVEGTLTNIPPGDGLILVWRSDVDEPSGKADDYVIGIIPNDGIDDGPDGISQRFSLDNNTEPSVTGVRISPSSPFSNDNLIAEYEFNDPDGDKESGSEIRWFKNGVEQTIYRNKKELPATATKRDEEWFFTIRPSDGKEFGKEERSLAVKIRNSPPVVTEAKLEPTDATTVADLKASYKYTDADNDPEVGTQIRWYADGVLKPDYNDKTLIPAEATTKNQTWFFTVLTSDGTDAGKIVESNRVKVANTAPSVGKLTIEGDYRDITIEFNLIDPDNDKCSLSVEYRGGRASNWTKATIKEPLTGLSPGSITLTWESAKDEDVREPTRFQIRVKPNDGETDGKAEESDFFTVDNNVPPIASNLKISPEKPTTSDNLTASYDYNDPDGGKESGSEIRWYKGDGIATDYRGSTLPASATAKGESWYFTVRPRDGAKFGKLETSAPVTILNSPPIVKNVAIVPTNPKSGDTLIASYDYRDLDEDRESGTEIQWYKNGVLELTKTFAVEDDRRLPTPVLKGEKWHVTVRPKDGTDFGEPVTSESVTVSNAPPVIESLTISGESGDITITYSLKDNDSDPCDLIVEYQGGSVGTAWTKATIKESTTKISPGTGLKLTWASRTDESGQRANDYRIRMTPKDSTSTGESFVSLKFALNNNSLPYASDLSISPERPTTSDDLKVVYTFVDPDGDKEAKPEIKWYKNGLLEILYDNRSVLPASATTRGDRWYYTIRVNDGKEYGKLQLSSQVVVVNEPPTVKDVKLLPESPKVGERLTASYTYVDADGDTEQGTKIEWYKNGLQEPAYDDLMVIPGNITLKNEEWYFTVRPKDGYDFGIPQASNKVYIGNTPPSVSALTISPANPRTTDDLMASYIYIDPDGDPEQGSKITWYKNSVVQPEYNDMLRLPSYATARKQVWYFEVLPKDGKQFGALKRSNSVAIINTPPRAENLRISPEYPMSKDDLIASYTFIDVDGDLEGRSEIKWYRNGVWMSSFDGLKKLPSKETSKGEIWHFTVRPKDDTDFGDLVISPSVEIESPIPRVNNLVIKPENPLTTDDLVAEYIFVDPNGIPEAGSKITWYRNGVAQTEYNNLRVLPSSATTKGEQWYFTVKPSNGSLFGKEQASAPVVIGNSAPKLTSAVPNPQNPTTDDSIMVDYIFTDPDGDVEVRSEIRWFRDGVLQPDYDNKTELPANATKRGEQWHFTVRASDGTTFSEIVTSAVVKIGNGRPKVIDPVISPADPKTTDDLRIAYTYIDTEGDPESGTEIRWFKNDDYQPDYHNLKVIPSSATSRDDKWYCTIKPRDGIDFGDVITSPVVTIGNTRPEVIDLTSASAQVFRGKSLSIIAHGKDADLVDSGPALKCQISYKFGNSAWVTLPTEYVEVASPHWEAIFSPDAKAQLGAYDFRVKFIDATGAESDWLEQAKMVNVLNSPPVIDATADDFRVKEDTVREFDLSPYGFDLESGANISWGIDPNSVNTGLFQASIVRGKFLEIKPADNKNGRDDITLTLTDADGTTVEKTDVTIIVDPVNDPPTAPASVRVTPEDPKTSDTLICVAEGSTDPDNDSVVYRYQWYVNGVIQSDLKSRDVHYARTAKGEVWRCEVTPSDGIADGPSRYAEVTIGNTAPVVSNLKVTGNTKDIVITFDLEDADGDNCELKLEYKIKGKVWKSATTAESTKGKKPGKGLTLTWRSLADEADATTDDCRLRLTPNDGALSGELRESSAFSLDNKPPEFTVTAVANPIHNSYIDITVVPNEEITGSSLNVSAKLSESEILALKMKSVGDNIWTGKLELKPGFDGAVLITVKAKDLVGNEGKLELQKEFKVPAPLPRPSTFDLKQNYPNPVVKDTFIPYQLAESSVVVIRIYNSLGQLVRTLNEGYKVAGFYDSKDRATYWDGKDDNGNPVSAGIYFYYFRAGGFEKVRKMAVAR